MRKLKVTEMGRITPKEFQQADKNPLVVVLDHVRSLYNVGSVFRTADWLEYACVASPLHLQMWKYTKQLWVPKKP